MSPRKPQSPVRAEVSKPSFGGRVSLFAYHPTPFGLSLSKARSISNGSGNVKLNLDLGGRAFDKLSPNGIGVPRELSHATAKRGLRYLSPNGNGWRAVSLHRASREARPSS